MNVTLSWIWLYHEYDLIIKWKRRGGGGGLVVVANTCKSACHSIRDLMLNIGRKFIVTIHDQYERPSPASMRTQTVHGSRVRQYVLLYHHRHLFYKHKSLPSLHQLLLYTNFSFKKRLLTPLQWYQIIISQNLFFFWAAGKNENGDNFHFSVYFGEKMNIDRN